MTAPDENRFDWQAAEADLTDPTTAGPDAEVVDLDDARARRQASVTPAGDGSDLDDDDQDAESVADTPDRDGGPVDAAEDIPPDVLARQRHRRPILADWARSWRGFRAAVKHQSKDAGYVTAYHAVRLPKYAAKTAVYAPLGLFRGAGRALHWASAEEGNWHLRQAAATRGDADTWMKLDARRQRQTVWRWWVLAGGAGATVAGAIVLTLGPSWWRWVALTAVLPLLATLGRPADKPLTDRVTEGTRYRKLTAELVRRALMSLQLPAINSAVAKDAKAISFPVDIHRDGPGHLAVVDLPYGVEASEVVARRGKLASAMRLPLDQVWPEPAPGHTGRLALWVGYEPASQMVQPPWPLLSTSARVDVFKPFPFATTPRLDAVTADLMFRNFLFGGQPGSGKTFALRTLLLAAALDPRTEIRGYELKGVGDFAVLEQLMAEYGNGFDDETLARCFAFIEWLYEECRRRSKRIEHYARLGKAPENKVTPELASLKGSGLHPLVAWFDELQELMTSKYAKEAGEILEKVIKLGRALGVIILIGTQIPDKDSLPTGITRNVNSRFCLSVADQTANDMILGTSAYKQGYRATVFVPVDEAGWGILRGFGPKPSAVKSYYVDTTKAAQIVTRAVALRTAAGTLPTPDEQTRTVAPVADVLGDLARVWPGDEKAVWNETLCGLLAELRPEVYGGWEAAQLSTALKPHPLVKVADVGRRIDGKPTTRRGIKHADILKAIAERDRKRSAG
ncbi:DNA segregation ATPase FtsK/SpoIIIE, S-DNA-T family [Micromonospora phaseoli]|uniref:DNA segregation ATPase FtsK/SpoIIIE, S-DNA-T family n=1 Tax=Micromonospora phaseoli TaxID=1144548 RepID=A0A1H7DYA9_9ACTN|nr:cell division protein FtsK [Micromonospora phaseoli]PZV89949.1 S-DNA-T family DNA segregation ATPase FtsK/SpoIIIE [Micromonospora phaseoli]GIJ81425.1 cell division protein FtsK [Micromonospora phaseoli]SEK05797.1 DNA segregation ATPase FtsK/SpoIIIE, S-DNA-T family [Micromonospora phaseoli]